MTGLTKDGYIGDASPSGKHLTLSIGGFLFFFVALEASLLGSGRLVMLGPLTLKMWLFFFAQIYVAWRFLTGATLRFTTTMLLLGFIILLALGVLMGVGQSADMGYVAGDVSPYLYMMMLAFCELTICNMKRVELLNGILKSSAIGLSTIYIVVVVLLKVGVINYLTLFHLLNNAGQEFSFRGTTEAMDYKGMMYVGIGGLLLMFQRSKVHKLLSVFAVLVVLATLTRGLALGFGCVVLVHLCTGRLSLTRKLVVIGISLLVVFAFISSSGDLSQNHQSSDNERIQAVEQVKDRITPLSLFVGKGLGIGVPIRPGHFEITYVEILYKQGLIGLAWWGAAFALVIKRYRIARRRNYRLAQPAMLGVVFVLVLSATNPYVGNPIGMFVLVANLAALAVLAEAAPVSESDSLDQSMNVAKGSCSAAGHHKALKPVAS